MVIRKLLTLLIVILIFGCASTTQQKQEAATAKPDFKKSLVVKNLLPPPPPVVREEVLEDDPLEGVFITLDAIEETLSSVLYMVAAEAGLNLIISPDINARKPFTLTVNNMPARDVLDIISDNAGIYYIVTGSSLKLVASLTKTFNIPYISKSTTQNAEIGGDVFGSAESSLKGDYSLKYTQDPEISNLQSQIASAIHSIIFPNQIENAGGSGEGEGGSNSSTGATSTTSGGASATGAQKDFSYFRGTEGYLYNIFTGVLKVITTPEKMKLIESYVNDVMAEVGKQVLIEAKLVEVILNDNSAYGINWQGAIDGNRGSLGLGTSGGTNFLSGGLTPVGIIANTAVDKWFAFMATQGRVESMGNPRIRVMNGQSAMISSGQLVPFWEMEKEIDGETNETTVTYTRVTVLDGVVLGVTAHVKNADSVTLNIVPVFSDVESVKTQYNEAGEVVASYPVINLKEAGTVLNVPSGQTIVMGGLISNVETTAEEKIPLLGDIPVLGYLFKGKSKVVEKRELVIFLKTTIIDG